MGAVQSPLPTHGSTATMREHDGDSPSDVPAQALSAVNVLPR